MKEQEIFLTLIEQVQQIAVYCTSFFDTISLIDLSLCMAQHTEQQQRSLPVFSSQGDIDIRK
jgi:DNA mismatch repair ATPase MutS